jgi:hypothetical protein
VRRRRGVRWVQRRCGAGGGGAGVARRGREAPALRCVPEALRAGEGGAGRFEKRCGVLRLDVLSRLMRERAITGGIVFGMLCAVVGLYATIYSHSLDSCGVADEGCDVPSPSSHPYTTIGVVLVVVGLVVFGLAIHLASKRATAR